MFVAAMVMLACLSACTVEEPPFFVDLRDRPVYVKEGFSIEDTAGWNNHPESGWIRIEGRAPVRISETPLGKSRIFLSPLGGQVQEYAIALEFTMDGAVLNSIINDTSMIPGMYFAGLGDNWIIYLNGNKVQSEFHLDGEGRILSHRSWHDVYFPVDKFILREGTNVVTLRIAGSPDYVKTGMFYSGAYAAPYETIVQSHNEMPAIALGAIYLFLGCYFLLIFCNHRDVRYNLYYGLSSALFGIHGIVKSAAVYSLLPDSSILFRIEYGVVMLALPMLMAFVEQLCLRRIRPVTRLYGLVCFFFSLSAGIFSLQYGEDILMVWKISALAGCCYLFGYDVVYVFFSRAHAHWKKSPLPQPCRQNGFLRYCGKELVSTPLGNIFIGMVGLFITGLLDIFNSLFSHNGFILFKYGFFIFTLGLALILNGKIKDFFNRLNSLNRALEESNRNLEKKVRRRTRELEKQKKAAEKASGAKSEFLARMSHEIRTPMNAILGMVDLMLHGDVPGELYENVVTIKHAGTNLLSIINEVLDFSKVESGRLELMNSEYSLSSLLNDCIAVITIRFAKKQLLFTADIDPQLPDKLIGDENKIREIVFNLLTNAFKYTVSGSVTFKVSGEPRGNDQNNEDLFLRFEVKDTGIGIKKEDIPRLFDSFARFDLAKNRMIEGTGLGLAITNRLCRLMGGEITVESAYGSGSTFTALVPQKIRSKTPLVQVFSGKPPAEYPHKRAVTFAAPGARALVVDDITANLKVAGGFLSLYRIDTDTCTGGEEALELIQKNRYDLVFMDHMMPGMDGVEAVERIRALDARCSTVPIIALTANAVSGMKEYFLGHGFNDYLAKPVEIAKMDELLKKWIPPEKQAPPEPASKQAETAKPPVPENSPVLNSPILIEGIDVEQGLVNCSGSMEAYQEVLGSFLEDAEAKLQELKTFDAGAVTQMDNAGLQQFSKQTHAVKGVSSIIGAQALSEKAAALETAGEDGDTETIQRDFPDFYRDLEIITGRVRSCLETLWTT
jgi:signal transduction histidine kinase/DNA-binding NarL/FixJ family response regulator/HPt (histidine-containing phosphotransfer) domain-containing protein